MYWCPWFGSFGLYFPDLSPFPKYTKTGITRLSVSFYLWVKFHLIWNVEFNILDDFLCIHALYMSFFPWFVPISKYTKTGITEPSDGLYTWVRHYLVWKVELNTFRAFLCMTLLLWFEIYGTLNQPQVLYNRWPSDDPETWVRCHLMWNIKLKTLVHLYVSFPMTWGFWAQIS